MPHDCVTSQLEHLRALCVKHRVRRLDIFGSAADSNGDRFESGRSDVDFLVEFEPQPRAGFDDVYFQLLDDLRALFGTKVDLVEAGAVRNRFFRASVEATRTPIYAAA
ncbi:MAG: nucleotidyltransferase family protein [Phycisphaerales bacterium]